jgi:chromate reductase, NAD(P)H dehydrogenase (quinone)
MNLTTPIRIGVVLGSSRGGQRLGERVVRFVLTAAKAEAPEAGFALLDLASYELPFFDEAFAPWDNPDRHPAPNVERWLEDMASADGYLFVVPEYNLAVPAVVKNALDLLAHEAEAKPASILSYSDTSYGGVVAGHELRLVLSKLEMLPLPRTIPLAHAEQLLDADGRLVAESRFAQVVAQLLPYMLRELVRYAAALRPVRQEMSAWEKTWRKLGP